MLCKVFIEKLTVSFLQYGLFHWRNIFFKCFLEQLTHSSFKSCMCFGVLTKDNIFLLSKFFVRNFGMQQHSASKQAASLSEQQMHLSDLQSDVLRSSHPTQKNDSQKIDYSRISRILSSCNIFYATLS